MPAKAEDSGIVETEPKELPVLAVHVLERLGYRVSRHSKRVGEILAGLQLQEQIGRDWFRSDCATFNTISFYDYSFTGSLLLFG